MKSKKMWLGVSALVVFFALVTAGFMQIRRSSLENDVRGTSNLELSSPPMLVPTSTPVSILRMVPKALPIVSSTKDNKGIVIHDSGGIVANTPLTGRPEKFISEQDLREMIATQHSQN